MCRCNHKHSRRAVLAMLAAAPVLGACKPKTAGAEEIRYGRETCEMCGMIISDPRFASEVRGGPDRRLVKFDDIGDAVHWLNQQDWKADPENEFWVMDSNTGTDWLDARKAFYLPGVMSPMDYGFAAVADREPGTVDFATMTAAVLDRGITSRCLDPVEHA